MSSPKTTRLHLLNEFELAPQSALFNQQTIAAVLSCSTHLLERKRWAVAVSPTSKLVVKFSIAKAMFSNIFNIQFIAQLVNKAIHSTHQLVWK
jgi:hypothetical protein